MAAQKHRPALSGVAESPTKASDSPEDMNHCRGIHPSMCFHKQWCEIRFPAGGGGMLLFPPENAAYPPQGLSCVWGPFLLIFSNIPVLSQDTGEGSILRLGVLLHSQAILGKLPKPWKLYMCSSKCEVCSSITYLCKKLCSSLQLPVHESCCLCRPLLFSVNLMQLKWWQLMQAVFLVHGIFSK